MFEQTRQRSVGAASELFELILAHPVDQETKDGEVFPGGDQPAERLEITLLIGPTHDVGRVDADIACQASELAEMVDFLSGGAGNH